MNLSASTPLRSEILQVQESKRVLLYEPRSQYRLSIVESLENLDCSCTACVNLKELQRSISDLQYDYILTPNVHFEQVQSAVAEQNLSVQVAAYADYGEVVKGNAFCTMLFPISCLQLSAVMNGHRLADSHPERIKVIKHFTAPTARVLVVDDNPVNLQVAKGLMEPYRFVVDTAANGIEAVQMVQRTEYDLVFMDHMMPEMDGADATIAIRALEGTNYSSLPIIALTANALVGTREMFISNGMNDFLSKPIELSKLAHILLKWLPSSKVTIISEEDAVKKVGEVHTLQIEGINTSKGLLSVGGSQENYMRILAAYHADGKRKCISLPQHLANNEIKAYLTEALDLLEDSAEFARINELEKILKKLQEFRWPEKIEKELSAAQTHLDVFDYDSILDCVHQLKMLNSGTVGEAE